MAGRQVYLLLMVAGLAASASWAAPVVTWQSDPVRPGEVVVVRGGGFGKAPTVQVGRVSDTAAGGLWQRAQPPLTVQPLQATDHSLKFELPPALPPGQFALRVYDASAGSAPVVLNAPDVWWLQGDQGETASPGGWVRLFGKCLGLGRPVQMSLVQGATKVTLTAQAADCWAARAALPAELAPGRYAVSVHNSFGGPDAFAPAGILTVAVPTPWKAEVFSVADFGPDADKAVRAALAKVEENKGGVVYFPRGRYALKGELVLPAGTTLRGEGMDLVSLWWPDMDEPPKQLISGPRFGIEKLAIYCQNHRNVITDQDDSVGTFLRQVRIRANCYFMIEDPTKSFRGRKPPKTHLECGAAIMLRGRNFQVTDCDVYASNLALRVFRAKVGVVAGNTFLYGGRGYTIENTDKLIFENNRVRGNNLLSIGNDVTTFWTSYCRNLYYAHNQLEQMYGADREMMTLDAGGGAYFGKVAAVDGVKVVLAADPTPKDYAPKPHTDWTGAAMMILDGTGAGQWRQVTRNEGRNWEVDREWTIPPDHTSLISVAPHRGRHLFIENTFTDGGAFQLYGAALDTIVAGNKGSRMDGFFAWGLNPHGWGWQPCFNCQFLDNELLEGNGYGGRSAFIGAFSSDQNETYAGPLCRGLIFRRNVLHNNSRMRFHRPITEVLVERNTVRHNDVGIQVGKGPTDMLLRENRFEDVAKPYDGDGLDGVLILPGRP